MIPAQISADYFGVSSRIIYRFIEQQRIHFVENKISEIHICIASAKEALELNP